MRHGDPYPPTPGALAMLDGDDPDLVFVFVDMDEWADVHPCECEALCECEADE